VAAIERQASRCSQRPWSEEPLGPPPVSVKLQHRLSWGYRPSLPKPPRGLETVKIIKPLDIVEVQQVDEVAEAHGCLNGIHRLMRSGVDVVAAAPARISGSAAWLGEETFPEAEKEAEFQESWRDENRATVGAANRSTCLRWSTVRTLVSCCCCVAFRFSSLSLIIVCDAASVVYRTPPGGVAEPGRVARLHRRPRRRHGRALRGRGLHSSTFQLNLSCF
jgi:hypothetical protein